MENGIWCARRDVSDEAEYFWLEYLNFTCIGFFGRAPEADAVSPNRYEEEIVNRNFGFQVELGRFVKDIFN